MDKPFTRSGFVHYFARPPPVDQEAQAQTATGLRPIAAPSVVTPPNHAWGWVPEPLQRAPMLPSVRH